MLWSGFTAFCIASRTPGRILPAAHPQIEFTTNMVVPGLKCSTQDSVDDVADTTVRVFRRVVPAAVGGIAFLSGGQSAPDASARLNAMHVRHGGELPWPLAFSFARAIQDPAMKAWAGKKENVAAAQKALVERAHLNRLAREGKYTVAMETPH